jgi:hypothetical protein
LGLLVQHSPFCQSEELGFCESHYFAEASPCAQIITVSDFLLSASDKLALAPLLPTSAKESFIFPNMQKRKAEDAEDEIDLLKSVMRVAKLTPMEVVKLLLVFLEEPDRLVVGINRNQPVSVSRPFEFVDRGIPAKFWSRLGNRTSMTHWSAFKKVDSVQNVVSYAKRPLSNLVSRHMIKPIAKERSNASSREKLHVKRRDLKDKSMCGLQL